jgi:hypothetical protein
MCTHINPMDGNYELEVATDIRAAENPDPRNFFFSLINVSRTLVSKIDKITI